MAENFIIAVTGDKGGVGKSTLVLLLTEWLKHQGSKVKVIDSDPTQNTQTWIDKCKRMGYEVNDDKPSITIVDTAGTSGASNTQYIRDANLIVIPFQPHVADLETVVGWFLNIHPRIAENVVFVPNRLENTKEQREGISQLQNIITTEGRGALLTGLANRPAVYPPLMNGSSTNFFDRVHDVRVREEVTDLMESIEQRLKG
jgi:cellulose biosynthesis protein BcsQ